MAELNHIYVSSVPQGNDQINNTQVPINGNFQDISQFLNVNHVGFNVETIFGNHTTVDLYAQDTDPATSGNEIALYSKPTSDASGQQLFYRYPNNGPVFQLTSTSTGSGQGVPTTAMGGYYQPQTVYGNAGWGPAAGYDYIGGGASSIGYQYLTGGILMLYGYYGFSYNGTPTPLPFPFRPISQIPAFTSQVFNLQISQSYQNINYSGYAVATPLVTSAVVDDLSQFIVNFSSPTTNGTFAWQAIGI